MPAILFSANAGAAPRSEAQQYIERARRKAEAFVRAAAVDLRTRSVAVRATVASDGRLNALSVVLSSGSRDIDRIIEMVLRRIVVPGAPKSLVGDQVTLSLGAAA